MSENQEAKNKLPPMSTMAKVGMVLIIIALAALFISPGSLDRGFMAMVSRAHPVVINTGILSTMSVSIILSVVMGRVLERLGFTDALMRVFIPVGKLLRINASVLVPCVYNILGDINAAGRIAGPILVKSKATNDEKKIAIFTMVQAMQSFSTFMLGIGAMTLAGVRVGLVVMLAIFAPIVICPFLARTFLYKDCKPMDISELPEFTPKTPFLTSLFAAGQEGMNVLLTLVLPAFAVVFGIIGLLTHIGIWDYFVMAFNAIFHAFSIEPATGLLSITASPTLAMQTLRNMLAGYTDAQGVAHAAVAVNPKLVIGSFVLAASGFPLSVIFGQIPLVWSNSAEMKASDALKPALLGIVFRILTAGFFAVVLSAILIG